MRERARLDAAVLVMAKAPQAGQVKTRLIPTLGAQAAADLHAQLVRQTLEIACNASVGPVVLCCAPDTCDPLFSRCADRYGVRLVAQCNGNLGQRMERALRDALRERNAAIVIGADCPAMAGADVRDAAESLHCGADIVLGPAEDGGYVLMGARRVDTSLFVDIPWGTEHVLAITRSRLRALQWRWQELRTLWDVDRPADLRRYDDLMRQKNTSGQQEEEGGCPEGPQGRRPVCTASARSPSRDSD